MAESALVIGRFTLQPGRQLLCGGAPVQIGAKTLRVLSALVETPGQVVTKDELMERVWPGLIVEENTLQAHISALRKALGEDGRWIATVQGRGYRFAGPAAQPEASTPFEAPIPPAAVKANDRRPLMLAAAGLAVAAVVTAGFTVVSWTGGGDRPAERPSRYLVLPFANRTGDPANEALADALSDETAARIAANAWDASVVAHNEAFALKGKTTDEATLGRQLGLDYIVEGSLQPSGAGLEAVAMLIDGRNGTHLAESRAIQIAAGPAVMRRWLAAGLTDQLLHAAAQDQHRRLTASPPDDMNPRNLLGRANIALAEEPVGGGWAKPLALIDQALAIAPHDPHALYMAGWTRTELATYLVYRTDQERDGLMQRAARSLGEAARLAPNRPVLHRALGDLHVVEGRYDAARAELERALELDATDEYTIGALAMQELYDGRAEQALAKLEEARPVSASNMFYVYGTFAVIRLHLGQDEAALEAIRHAVAVDAEDPWAWTYLIGLLELTGRTDEVPDALARLKSLNPWITVARLESLDIHASPAYRARQARLYHAWGRAGVPAGESEAAWRPVEGHQVQ